MMGPVAPVPLDAAAQEVISQGKLARVSRRTLADGSRLIVKELLGQNAVQRARHERRILERLSRVTGVPRLVAGPCSPSEVLLEEVEGRPLSEQRGAMEVAHLVQLAARLSATLAELHREGVVHKNINPGNVLVRPGGEPVLIDFTLATTFAEERPPFVHHRDIAGELPYLAPEQTGRTGRSMDQRADLYALGATLYRLGTGAPPFEEKDPLQLVHDILALVPVPPAWRNPRVPRPLNDIVMRLLEKEPDRRYQSAFGVAYDLARLTESLWAGTGEPFALGERDFAFRLSPPSRLIGREREVAALGEALEGCLAGRLSVVLAAGSPGVGKSALLSELRPMVTARRGFFAAGKFDQHRRDLESDGVWQALRALGRLLLAEPDRELAVLRHKIVQGLGPNAGLAAALQPELALLMGIPGEEEQLNGKERLVQATLDLLKAVATPERPLVLVIDDLQWAPAPPIALVDALANSPVPGLLVVCAFRENEVTDSHPLVPLLARWLELPHPPVMLLLGNLQVEDLALFLKEMLRLEPGQSLELARAIEPRTGGNAYDTVELVNALRRDGALVPGRSGWSWDREAIRRYVGSGDVAGLLERRIAALPPRAQGFLEAMACLGGEVDPELMTVACGVTADELEEGLTPTFQDGLVVSGSGGVIRFRHDLVQQAAYARLAPEAALLLHLALARRLAPLPERETLAAEQYYAALEGVGEEAEKREVIALFRRAASRARRVNSRETERFVAAASRLLEGIANRHDPELLLALETERHAALYALGRLEEADGLYARVEALASHPLQRADAACIQICSLTNRGMQAEAVELGLALLGELGVAVPAPEELEAKTLAALGSFSAWIGRHDAACDAARPELSDPAALAAARLINPIIPSAFFIDRAMVSWWLVIESQRLWIEHGPCAELAGPLSHLGFVHVHLNNDYRSGEKEVGHVLSVSEARGWEPETSQVRFIHAMTVRPWTGLLQENVLQALRAEEGLLQGGDLQNACFTYYATMAQLFDCAPTLERYSVEIERALAFAARTGNLHIRRGMGPFRKLACTLREEEHCCNGTGCGAQEAEAGGDGTSLAILHISGAICAALSGSPERLWQHTRALFPYLPYTRSTHLEAQAVLLLTLAAAQQAQVAEPAQLPWILAEFERGRDFLSERAAVAPGNFRHLLKWVKAERSWALGEFQAAAACFDAALWHADRTQRPWHRALITERAALFHLEHGLNHLGRMLLDEARRLYEEWGATGKVRQMEDKHPFLRRLRQGEAQAEAPRSVSGNAIDMLAILRASQALSSETSLERLRTVVVELLLTMTGATAVSLVVRQEQEEGWFLLPPLLPEDGPDLLPLEEAARRGLLPVSVFNFAERTAKPLMVDDATRDDRFSHDRYLADYACCSILAVPILNHGAPRALLLLENRLSRGAFTPDLLDAVTLIAGQLAVSLENALLYRKLEERVRERTRELQEAHSDLMAAARHAGMAEIASNLLHNVGNVLNSVNVSAGVAMERLRGSRLPGLARAAALLREHEGELAPFLAGDERGRMLPAYLEKLAGTLDEERQGVLGELSRLATSVDHIKEIVAVQQRYAGASSLIEPVQVRDLVEDALRMNQEALARHRVAVLKELPDLPELPLDKARVLQILVNLVANAKQAMDDVAPEQRRVTIAVELSAQLLRITVSDRGVGIPPENLSRIFSHGFTTKKGGHGFGLHSCAVAAREMGGSLAAHSAGSGAGASFVLEIPVRTA